MSSVRSMRFVQRYQRPMPRHTRFDNNLAKPEHQRVKKKNPTSRTRPSWEEYLLGLAHAAAARSEDPWVQVGAVAARENNSVVGSGYNGPPPGREIDWSDRDARRRFVVHAEVNALAYARPGEAHILASTLLPCPACMTLAASYGIRKVVFTDIYERTEQESMEIASAFGVKLIRLPRPPAH